MKAMKKYICMAFTLGVGMLIMGPAVANQDTDTGAKTAVTENTLGYDAGYELGCKQALLHQQQP